MKKRLRTPGRSFEVGPGGPVMARFLAFHLGHTCVRDT
jgi:hypothetical protein